MTESFSASASVRERLAAAARVIRDGGLVCFPTESTYGLAADVRNRDAIERLVDLKGRDSNAPMGGASE